MKYCFAAFAGIALGSTAFAQPLPPGTRVPPPLTAPQPNPALEAAQQAFDALPEGQRKQIQEDLIWASNFTAVTSGQFGPRTYQSIQNFQRMINAQQNGILDAGQRSALASAAARARSAARIIVQIDPRTGASMPVSQALFTRREQLPNGTRWESTDGQVVLETAVAQGGASQLPAAFDRFVNVPTPGRRVTYRLLRPDFFVVTGEVGQRSFYVRYAAAPTNIRGYALSYPTARSGELERHVISIANGFQAVPGQQVASAPQPQAPDGGIAPTAPGQQGTVLAPRTPAAQASTINPGLILTGGVIAPNRVATAAFATTCPDVRVNGKPARVISPGNANQPAILEADTGNMRPLNAPMSNTPVAGGLDGVVVVGFSPGARPTISVASGEMVGSGDKTRVAVPLHREGGGSLILDRSGNLVGLLNAPQQAPRMVAGIVPAVSHDAIKLSSISLNPGALSPSQPTQPRPAAAPADKPKSAGAIAADVASSLVAISCGQPVTLPK